VMALSLNLSRRLLSNGEPTLEQGATRVKVVNPGILKLPAGGFGRMAVAALVKKMVARGKSIGNQAVSRAIQNLVRFNKNKNPKLSAKAKAVAAGFSREIKKQKEDVERKVLVLNYGTFPYHGRINLDLPKEESKIIRAEGGILQELTVTDIRRGTDSASKTRSKTLKSFWKGMTREGIIKFQTTSQTTPGKKWNEKIELEDLALVFEIPDEGFTARDRVRLAFDGDVRVSCDCPAFLYWGWRFLMTQTDAILSPKENRFPSVRNPNLKGSVCKHLESVLRVLPFHISDITTSAKKIFKFG